MQFVKMTEAAGNRKPAATLVAAVATLGLAVCSAQAATLYNIATIDLSSTANSANAEFIGSNPSAVAWTGSRLYVAGFNGGTSAASVGIVEVTNPLTPTPGYGTVFGQRASTAASRGYSGLDANDTDTLIGASYDSGGNIANGVATYTLGGTLQAGVAFRGFAGPSFDPGFNAAGAAQGLGWTRDGSGRRALFNPTTGAEIYTTGNGMLHNSLTATTGTLNRDIDFDPDTGDIYVRVANYLVKTTRSGDNSTSGSVLLFNPGAQAAFINGQNLQYISDWGGTGNDFVMYNPRADANAGKVFGNTVLGVTPAGVAEALTFLNLDGSGPFVPAGTSTGYYDFSYDRATSTLAVLDFSNRRVYIFDDVAGVVPEPSALGLVAAAGLMGLRRRRD